jgi:hypothetical protein
VVPKRSNTSAVSREEAPELPQQQTASPADDFWSTINTTTFRAVPTVHVSDEDAKAKLEVCRVGGIPCIVQGHAGWASFAYKWLRPLEGESPITTLERGDFELDVQVQNVDCLNA